MDAEAAGRPKHVEVTMSGLMGGRTRQSVSLASAAATHAHHIALWKAIVPKPPYLFRLSEPQSEGPALLLEHQRTQAKKNAKPLPEDGRSFA
jgi:hypothetical protein